MIPGVPDHRPHLRCQQCERFLPTDDAVARLINECSAPLCEECYTMQQRSFTDKAERP